MTESFEDAIKALRHIARGNGSVLRIADRIVAAHECETKVEGVCGPITGELREYATVAWNPWPEARDRLYQMCDAIDSIHAQLERENADLRMKFVNANRHAQHVERENESLKAELELDRVLREQEDRNGWLKDVDGVPINIGDVMVYADGNTCPLSVVALVPPAVFLTDEGPRYADMCRHQPDTWERILADALGCEPYEVEGDDDLMALVARCKKLAGDAE